jgi:acetyltransferase-like isoleucine patch superfamily enzyme
LAKRLTAAVRRIVQIKIWGMDIHPSAWIEPSAYIDRTWPRGVHIGPGCFIGDQAVVLTHDFTRGIYFDTRIRARAHIGARAIVMPGVSIGEDCILMPGAMVTKDMPPGTIAIGNPAAFEPRS